MHSPLHFAPARTPRLTPIPQMRRHLDNIKSLSTEEQVVQLRALYKLTESQALGVIQGWKDNTLDQHIAP